MPPEEQRMKIVEEFNNSLEDNKPIDAVDMLRKFTFLMAQTPCFDDDEDISDD